MIDEPTRRLDEGALRALVPRVLAGLVRRGEEFAAAEDALQAAVLEATEDGDDTLFLLFCCRHSDLTPASQVALTLRAVGGLTTREIADAFYVPEPTMAQRFSRGKRTLQGRRLDLSGDLAIVLRVLRGVRASAGAAWGNSMSTTGEFRRAPSCDGAPITQRPRPPCSTPKRRVGEPAR